MKVEERFTVDPETLENLRETSDYWENVYKFWQDIKEQHIDDLTPGQVSWLEKIELGVAKAEGLSEV